MAIKPGYKTFTFDGENSGDYGIYITGSAVYNAPERDVEMIKIPGRSGAFVMDNGRFENIEVTYPAGIYAESQEDFAQALSDLRNMLASRKGYCRLTDEYNPEEYRMAVYKSGLDVDPVAFQRAGEFTITFDCKPQRWLTSGEELVDVGEWINWETESGPIVEIEATETDAVKSLVADIEPIQSGSGTPSPDNVRPISGHTDVVVTVADDYDNPTVSDTYTTSLGTTVYGGTLDVTTGVLTVDRAKSVLDQTFYWSVENSGMRIKTSGLASVIKHNGANNTLVGAICDKFEERTPNQTWSGGASGIGFSVGPNGDVHFCQTGEKNMGHSAWVTYVTNNPIELVYELATPTTTTLTAQQIDLLLGTNNIWADTGDVTLEYGQNPNVIINPTLFESSPLLEVEGYGTIGFNGYEIELINEVMGTVLLVDERSAPMAGYNTSLAKNIMNNGDTFFTDPSSFYWAIGLRTAKSVTISSVSDSDASVETVQAGNGYYTNIPMLGGTYGTASVLLTNNTTITGTYVSLSDTTQSFTITLTTKVSYTVGTTHRYQFTRTVSGLPASLSMNYSEYPSTLGRMTGDSTVSILGHPTIVDCDLGEAYKEVNGEFVSLNAYIDLGSKLPTLASGANAITYDNTITDLKITPRWWKV